MCHRYRARRVNVSPLRGVKFLFCSLFSTDEGANDGGSISRRPWNAMQEVCWRIAEIALAVGAFERGVEHAGLDDVFTGDPATATLVLQTTVMHRAIADTTKLVNNAVISARHAARTKAQMGDPTAA